MAEQERGVRWPDGVSVSVPVPFGRFGGTYYSSPGSPTAPHLTLTRSLGVPGIGANAVFLRDGMTSENTLGTGMSGNVSTIIPSVTLNATIPSDGELFPKPRKARVTSVEAGIGTPNAASLTSTFTPQQVADFLTKHVIGPAMGPNDELSPFVRTLQSSVATVGDADKAPVRHLGVRSQFPLGGGMSRWRSSVDADDQEKAASTGSPGGLLGLLQDHLRDR